MSDIDAEGLPFHVTLAVANRTASSDELLEVLAAKSQQFSEPGKRQLFLLVVPPEGGPATRSSERRPGSSWCWTASESGTSMPPGWSATPTRSRRS